MKAVFDTATEKMNKTVASLKYEYGAIRAGRASAAVLDPIKVDYWGVPTPINQMAAINVTEARILTIQPWDKSSLKLIEKAIMASDIGINTSPITALPTSSKAPAKIAILENPIP